MLTARGVRAALAAAAVAVAAVALVPAHASTGVTVTPAVSLGSGLGFDACEAPSTAVLRAWSASPYRSVNVYFGGSQRGCPNQPNLTADWVTTVLSNGWSLIPTYVDLQAPSPCYGGTKGTMNPATATSDGNTAGTDAATQLQNLGITSGVAYLDLEPFDVSKDPTCGSTVLAFTDAWTQALHNAGYSSGVYVNANHGAQTFVDAYDADPDRPDDIWVADWNANPSAADAVIGEDWPHHRLHQYYSDNSNGTGAETYGSESLTIDRDAIDGDVVSAQSVTRPTGPPYGYAVSGTPSGLNERAAPTSSATLLATDPNGTSLQVQCQAAGQSVDGDVVWDLLTNGNYVSDLYTTTTGRNGFSSFIARCDTTAPTVSLHALPVATTATAVTVAWTSSDAVNSNGAPNGVANTVVRFRTAPWNGSYGFWRTLTTTTRSSIVEKLSIGYTYCFQVQSRDRSGNASSWSAVRCISRALDDRSLALGSGWARHTAAHLYLGTYTSTTRSGHSLTRTKVVAARISIVATTCATCGTIRVSLAGHLLGTISLHASSTHYQRIFVLPASTVRTGTLVITTTRNGLVEIDGFAVSRS